VKQVVVTKIKQKSSNKKRSNIVRLTDSIMKTQIKKSKAQPIKEESKVEED